MTAGGADFDALFERARQADIEAVAGVKLWRAGKRMRGECPICGASSGKRADGAFSVDAHARVFKCFSCDAGGDVIDLEQQLRGGTAREAAERLAGPAPAAVSRAPLAPRPVKQSLTPPASALPARIWVEALSADTARVRAYLESRAIGGWVLDQALRALRFHPSAPHHWDEELGRWVAAPAMVARVVAPSGPTGGVHVTYLRRDRPGRDKTLGKRMFGPQLDADDKPGGAWLIPRAGVPRAPLIVAEGIETALSAAMIYGRPCRVVAALSLNRLQGGWLPDRFGRYDVEIPRMDPEKPAFTWPTPAEDPWPEVLVGVDRDMAPVRVKVRALAGKSVWKRLDPETRARVSGSLAEQHWRAAGAPRARTIAPAAGSDFNDQLRGGADARS